jgi:hypothetical protein
VTTAKLEATAGGYQLSINGKPSWLNGACGRGRLEELAAAGANSIRTWGAADDPEAYRQAEKLGIYVLAGLPFAPSLGPDRAIESARAHIIMHKDADSIVAWSIGNEIENDGRDIKYWRCVEDMAKIAKAEDPGRLVITVVAELSPKKAALIDQVCPSLDAIGVNAYASATTVGDRVARLWTRPFVVTELGPPGPWETGKTPWHASLEHNSSMCAAHCAYSHKGLVERWKRRCVGSYVYFWGTYLETITKPNWGEMWLPTGEPLGGVDLMTTAWGGKPVGGSAPVIDRLDCVASLKRMLPGEEFQVSAKTSGERVDRVRWEVRSDFAIPNWSPTESMEMPECVLKESPSAARFAAPQADGAYRVYFYAFSATNKAAVGSVPVFVKGAKDA